MHIDDDFCLCSISNADIKEGIFIVPFNVKFIDNNAFRNRFHLTEIFINFTVISIGKFAFMHCHSLINITIFEGLISIETCAFAFCYNLKKIIIPYRVISIGKGAFLGCSALEEMTLPGTLTSIGEDAFNECKKIKKIFIKAADEKEFNRVKKLLPKDMQKKAIFNSFFVDIQYHFRLNAKAFLSFFSLEFPLKNPFLSNSRHFDGENNLPLISDDIAYLSCPTVDHDLNESSKSLLPLFHPFAMKKKPSVIEQNEIELGMAVVSKEQFHKISLV